MAGNHINSAGERASAFELKAAGFTLPIIRLLQGDIEAVAAELGARVEQAPEFFRNTPVVIDLSSFPTAGGEVEFPLLVGLLRGYGMIPFGVRGGNKQQNAAAEAMELAILGEHDARGTRSERATLPEQAAVAASAQPAASAEPAPGSGPTPNPTPAAPPVPPPAQPPASKAARPEASREGQAVSPRRPSAGFTLVTRPVRSGQRVYAAGGDLSVIAAVSAGAELMADGNIHVYGPLRGRALAGMKGNMDARIFCQDLQAELVSVAGHYRVSESIPAELRGIPVQIFLDQKILRIEKL